MRPGRRAGGGRSTRPAGHVWFVGAPTTDDSTALPGVSVVGWRSCVGVSSGAAVVGGRRSRPGPVLRMVQGAAWMRRWWWPQTKIRFSSDVGPPLIQCSRWWAWHISGGRVQCGNRQCWSRATSAFQIAGVTRRRRRPTSRTSDLPPRTPGMTSASQHNRRTALGESCSPVSVVATPERSCRSVRPISRVSRGTAPWEVGSRSAVCSRSAALDQGVEHPGAVVTGVASVVTAAWQVTRGRVAGSRLSARCARCSTTGVGRGMGCGQRDQGGLDQGRVLAAAAAFDPGTAALVLGDGQVPAQVGGAFEAVQLALGATVVPVGIDDGQESVGELAQLGRIQRLGLIEQDRHRAGADVGVTGQGVDGPFDHVRLGRGEPAVAQGLGDRGRAAGSPTRPRVGPLRVRCLCGHRRPR